MSKNPFFDDREHIFENSIGFVIFDNYPVSKGHSLIIPKRIYSNYFDSSDEELKGLNELIFKTKIFLDKKFKPQGYNVGINCGQVSGQTIDQVHIHLIPRYKNDVENPRGGVRGVIPEKQSY
jgi:diadenosine tetraphosphate (Ap4A) HIT family hydrolase